MIFHQILDVVVLMGASRDEDNLILLRRARLAEMLLLSLIRGTIVVE